MDTLVSENLIPEGGQNDNVLVSLRTAKLLECPQIATGFDTEPKVGYSLEVDETAQLSFLAIPSKLPLDIKLKSER